MNDASMQLIHAYIDDELTVSQRGELSDWLRLDRANVELFVTECRLHSELCDKLCDAGRAEHDNIRRSEFVDRLTDDVAGTGIENPFPALSPLPSLSTTHYPLSTDFVGGPVFSYMVATVVLCVMLLGAWVYKISNVGSLPDGMAGKPQIETPYAPAVVGQITGMKDCRWSQGEPGTIVGASVPRGRKYSLESGLLQITYSTGANVILEGPCEYIANSRDGGYLRIGKLVAKVNKRVDSGQWLVASAKTRAALTQPPASRPQPLFSVYTPTAIVTDLGTEFGVEVDESGGTTSRVFQGSVRIETVGENLPSLAGRVAGSEGRVVQLGAGESARVDGRDEPSITVLGSSDKVADFIREIPQRTTKTFDLVDVVAGGDGFSGRRNSGIDPTNGRVRTLRLPTGVRPLPLEGDGQYHSVAGMPFIDGVFIPDGGGDAVQVDSAGHVFDWFPDTANATWQVIWAGGAFTPDLEYSSKIDGVDYASSGHGLLMMNSNVAITFDLEAIRRTNPESKLLRFRANAGTSGPDNVPGQYFADVLVLIDGTRRFQHRLEYNGRRAASISVAIQDKERFLTLAVTDAGDGYGHDWVVFGDPRLEMSAVGKKGQKDEVEPKRE